MKSKILLDIDQDNQPVITIKNFETDDLKDRLLMQFIKQCYSTDNQIDGQYVGEKFLTIELKNSSNSIIDETSNWAEYIVKPHGYSYLLKAYKTESAETKYIKLIEVNDYLKNGYKVTFADQFTCLLTENNCQKLTDYENKKSELEKLQIANKQYAKSTVEKLTKIHVSHFINSGIVTIVEKDNTVLDAVLNELKNNHNITVDDYTLIADNGINTIKLNKLFDSNGEQLYKDIGVELDMNGTNKTLSNAKSVTNYTTQIDYSKNPLITYTSDNKNNKELRRSGQTTRLIDKYVQQLFTGFQIVVKDHIDKFHNNVSIFNKLIKRLEAEHKIDIHSFEVYDNNRLTLKLKNFYIVPDISNENCFK